jgi:cation diffusion facilitator family transporter
MRFLLSYGTIPVRSTEYKALGRFIMNKLKAQVFEGILSVVINAILFGIKFWAGLVTGSIALIADAWHTLSDSFTSVFIIISAKLSSKKPDKEHPFGHGRWEQISSIFIAFALGIIAYDFMINSIERFQNRESVVYGTLAIVVTIVSIIVKELLAQCAFYIGRKTDNVIIKADGWHHRSDSLSSVVVLIGILITKFAVEAWWMDSILGMLCALAIFYAAFQVLKETVSRILGEEPKQEMIDEINNEANKMYDFDLKLHHFHLHDYISQKELTLHMMVDKDMTVETGHDIATAVEDLIKEKFDMEATIHIEPLEEL